MIAGTHKLNSKSNRQVLAAFVQKEAAIDAIEATRTRAVGPHRAGATGGRTGDRILGSRPRTVRGAHQGPIA